MRLLLVRHCEARRGTEGEDHGLTESGLNQARGLRHLIPPHVSTVLSSPSARTMHTAKLFSEQAGLPVNIMNDLSEIGDLCENEDVHSLVIRAGRTMNRISEDYGNDSVVAFTHAGFIMASIRAIFNIPTPGTGARLEPDYGSRTSWHKDGPTWFLESYNVTDGAA